MNKNLLEEIKRMNNLMGTKSILLETGKQTYQLIDNTIGWKKVGEFFDDLFDGVGRRSGNDGADEVAYLMSRDSDIAFRETYESFRLKAKADLQSYANTLSNKLQRGATNLTPDEKKLLVLLEKFAQTKQDTKAIKEEIPIIKQKVSKNLAGQERYTMVSDEVYGKVVNEIETKIANGEQVSENDLLNLYKAELNNLKKLDANGNPVGDLLPPELKQAMVNKLKTQKKYKHFVDTLSVKPEEVAQENVRRVVNDKPEELSGDVSDLYNGIKDKDIDADLITENSNLKNLQNKLSTETDPLKKIDIQREIRLTESKIKVLEKEKELKNAVTDWVTGKSSTATDVRRVADELVNNREATDVLGDVEKRIFGDAYVGTQKTWSDYFIGFTDFLRGKKCSYAICKLYRGWWDLTGMSLIMDIIQNLSKVLDDILEVKKGNFLGFINYGKLRDPEFFQQQYKEIMNGMQEIAARKEKGWQQKLQLERDRLLRLIETRRPATDDKWIRLVDSNADLDDQANAALVDASKKIKDAVREADARYAPGLKGLKDWLETQGTDGLDFFETLETFLNKIKDAISTNQSWLREMTPFMKKSKGSYDKIKELNVGRSTLNGDPMEKPLKDATEKLKGKTGNVTEKAASISQIMSIIWNSIKKVADSKLVNWAINYARYGLFTKLDVFKQILMRHGYAKGLLILYLKVVIGFGLVKAVGYLWDYISSAILDALVSVGQMEPATAQIFLTWAIHPITSIKAYRGDKESILYLALETDRLREQKKVFWQGLFDKFFDPENLKVYPFIEEFLNMFRLLANTYNHFSGQELKDFEDDLSVIGGKTSQILQFLLGGVFGFDYFIKKEDASIFDLEKGLQKKIEEYMKDLDTLRKSSLKDVMGDDFDKLVLSARQKKLDSISPYIRGGCYKESLLKLLKAKIDVNPKLTKPFTEITLDKAKTVDENKKRSLSDKISSLSSTTMKVDDPNFNIQFSETVGLVIGQDFYRIERGPILSDGTTIQPDTFAPNVFGGSKNSKCCTFMDVFIKKEEDTNWYCLASPKVMEMIGGNAGAKQMVTIQEDVDARAVFEKIIDGTKSLENQKIY
jgi:hypothetical protein